MLPVCFPTWLSSSFLTDLHTLLVFSVIIPACSLLGLWVSQCSTLPFLSPFLLLPVSVSEPACSACWCSVQHLRWTRASQLVSMAWYHSNTGLYEWLWIWYDMLLVVQKHFQVSCEWWAQTQLWPASRGQVCTSGLETSGAKWPWFIRAEDLTSRDADSSSSGGNYMQWDVFIQRQRGGGAAFRETHQESHWYDFRLFLKSSREEGCNYTDNGHTFLYSCLSIPGVQVGCGLTCIRHAIFPKWWILPSVFPHLKNVTAPQLKVIFSIFERCYFLLTLIGLKTPHIPNDDCTIKGQNCKVKWDAFRCHCSNLDTTRQVDAVCGQRVKL